MQEERGLADEEARQRDSLYERAERLAASLGVIGDSLRDAVADVNAGKAVRHTFPSFQSSMQSATVFGLAFT